MPVSGYSIVTPHYKNVKSFFCHQASPFSPLIILWSSNKERGLANPMHWMSSQGLDRTSSGPRLDSHVPHCPFFLVLSVCELYPTMHLKLSLQYQGGSCRTAGSHYFRSIQSCWESSLWAEEPNKRSPSFIANQTTWLFPQGWKVQAGWLSRSKSILQEWWPCIMQTT